jgi:hypothetical protein
MLFSRGRPISRCRGLRDRDAEFEQLTVARHAAEATARGEPATPEPQPGTGAPPSEPADGGTPPQTGHGNHQSGRKIVMAPIRDRRPRVASSVPMKRV